AFRSCVSEVKSNPMVLNEIEASWKFSDKALYNPKLPPLTGEIIAYKSRATLPQFFLFLIFFTYA
ncbi:MAG: hypothetical protein AAF546_11190, partial [Verrucomicrobiota bacterium]